MARTRRRVDAKLVHTLMERGHDAVRKRHKGAITDRATTALADPSVWVSTGALSLDRICAGRSPGGLVIGPQGRVIHIAGDPSTGKSILLDHTFLSTQRLGGLCYCSETEGTRDTHFAKAIGLDLSMLEVARPDTLEEAIDMGLTWHDAIRASSAGRDVPICWGFDSLDSTEAGRAASGGLTHGGGWRYGGGKSEALGAGLRKIVKRCARFPTTFILLNQTRYIPGAVFGPKKQTTGGAAPHFYSSIEIMLTPSPLGVVRSPSKVPDLSDATLKRFGLKYDRGFVLGRWVRAKVTKTKIAPTMYMEADFYIDFRKGIHRWGGFLPALVREGIAVLDDDGLSVQHISDGGKALDFASVQDWVAWLKPRLATLGGIRFDGAAGQADASETD